MTRLSKLVQRVLFCVPFFWGLNACTYQYTVATADKTLQYARLKENFSINRNADWIVHGNTAITLAHPVQVQSKNMPRNLHTLYQSLDIALKQVFPSYSTHSQSVSLDKALELARSDSSELLFWPSLVLVENKLNTEQELREGKALSDAQSYGPDRAVFQVLIYEVRTKKLIDVGSIVSRSRMFAPNDSLPLDLYRGAARHYIHAITGKKAS